MDLIFPMALLLRFLMCLRNVNVLSKVTPRYRISGAQPSSLSERVSLENGISFLRVNRMA